jgi:hypothetical protein
MGRTGDIIALFIAGGGCTLLGWAAVHVAAKFERQRAIHLLEEHGYAQTNTDSPRRPRWVARIRAVFYPTTENDPKP